MNLRCSSLSRYHLCHGAAQAEEKCPPQPESADAAEGKAKHELLATLIPKRAEVKPDDDSIPWDVRQCLAAIPTDGQWSEWVEFPVNRLTLSGHPDFVMVGGTCTHIFDWKFGWAADRGEAADHIQGMGYVYCLIPTCGRDTEYFYHLVAPNAPDPEMRHTIARFDKDAVRRLEEFIVNLMCQCGSPLAERKPSLDACRFCRAKCTIHCPESGAELQNSEVVKVQQVNLPALPNAKLLELMEAAKLAQVLADAILDEGRARLKSGAMQSDAWLLSKPVVRRSIASPLTVWRKIKDHLGSNAEAVFLDCCSTGVASLISALAAVRGIKKKEAEEALYRIIGDDITVTEGEPKLQRRK